MAMFPPRQLSRELDGNATEVLVQTFADRILVLVTQVGKVGNLIQATLPDTTPLLPPAPVDDASPNALNLPPPPPAIQLTPLLGNGGSPHLQTLHSLYASQIATIVWSMESNSPLSASRRSVIIGIALRKSDGSDVSLSDAERSIFNGVMSMVQQILAQ